MTSVLQSYCFRRSLCVQLRRCMSSSNSLESYCLNSIVKYEPKEYSYFKRSLLKQTKNFGLLYCFRPYFNKFTEIIGDRSINKKQIMAASKTASINQVKQIYDYFLVLDFEATCDKESQPNPQEIIEFPVLKVNASTMKVDSVFHSYVRPQFHPQLSPFCTELTGIIQSMVEHQSQFAEVFQSFHRWMESEGLLQPNVKSIFVTCGDWDLKTMLPKQCAVLDIAVKPYFKNWINIKKSFAEVTSMYPKGMMVMLNNLSLRHVGRHHSGIDDCQNIANILIALMKRGHILKQNNITDR